MSLLLKQEIKRLRALNKHIGFADRGWLKLVAVARVNVCRNIGADDTLAMDILRAHQTGYDKDIVVNV